MIGKDAVVAVVGTFCITAALFMIIPSSSQTYDPWLDYDENGIINMLDLYNTAVAYGAMGDPTKNVNVMNWPVTNQQTVWYGQTGSAASSIYNASGFGHIHLVWSVAGLTGDEYVTIYIYAFIYSPSGSSGFGSNVQSITITSANDEDALTYSVFSERFQFYLSFASGTTASVYFAFYLTYA